MPKNGIIYDLLIAGPSDTKECFEYVMRAIERFNIQGRNSRITIVGESLGNGLFAESGGQPRELVRNQIMGKYDMMIIVFGKDYTSFEKAYYIDLDELIKWFTESRKQIFAYFINKKVAILDQEPAEIKKIDNFRKEYSKKYGFFITVPDERELETRFYSDIQKYFANLKDNQNEKVIQMDPVKESALYSQNGAYYLPYGCFGRDKKLKDFERTIAQNSGPVVIKGVAGVGKTAFCSFYYQQRNQGEQKFSMPFVNLENCMSKADFIHSICAALQIKEAFMELDAILKQICGNKSYDALFFDNWEDFQCAALNSNDWYCVYRFINTLASNGFQILISSQEKVPNGWHEFRIDVLEPEDGRIFFVELLKRRGKDINNVSAREYEAFEKLLVYMENHPLTMVLTSSLIEDPNDTLERIESKWSEVCDQSASKRHQSMEIALQMSYETVSSTPGAATLWGLITELNIDFPSYFIDVLQQLYPQISWDEARKALSNRSLIQFSENASGIHMLMPVKAQWKHFVGKADVVQSLQMWGVLIKYAAEQSAVSENTRYNPELSNRIRGIVLDCMRSFMSIISLLIKMEKFQIAETCIIALQDYYESLSDSAFEFLDSLPLKNFSAFTKGLVMKCKGDICRLGKKDKPNIANDYYKDALKFFQEDEKKIWSAQVMDVMGKNQYWNFHDTSSALDWIGKSETLSREISYSRGIAEALKDQAIILTGDGKYTEAIDHLEEAYQLFSCLGDYQGIAHVLKRQGVVMQVQGNLGDAIEKYEQALGYYERAHYIQGQGDTLSRMCIGYIELEDNIKLNETIILGERLMDKIPYQMTKNDLQDSIEKGKHWLLGRKNN